jgi:hypothetical protein
MLPSNHREADVGKEKVPSNQRTANLPFHKERLQRMCAEDHVTRAKWDVFFVEITFDQRALVPNVMMTSWGTC